MTSRKHEAGMTLRRAVPGDAYIDKAIAGATEFAKPLQDMVTENCWGEVWTRDDLPRKTRNLITLATLAALKGSEELKGHVLGALRNDCTVEEIRAVLLHSTVYCGVPSGIEAFRAAKPVIEAWQLEHGSSSGTHE